MKKIFLKMNKFIKIYFLMLLILVNNELLASNTVELLKGNWRFAGPFGKFDNVAIQRGLKVFHEVCATCHAVNSLSFRRLAEVGFSEAEVKQFASQFQILDGPNDDGEMFERPGIPSDYWPSVYKNDKQAMLANNGAVPPDLSIITKAREGYADYVYSLLQGYKDAPEGFAMPNNSYYNLYMNGHVIAMAPPLIMDGQIEYDDDTKATIQQMAHDVVNFLQWVAEPEMEKRKALGIKAIIFASVMTIFFYLSKKRIWARLKK